MATCRTLTGINKEDCFGNAGGIKSRVWIFDKDAIAIIPQMTGTGSGDGRVEWADGIVHVWKAGETDETTSHTPLVEDTDYYTLNFRKQSSSFNSEATIDPAQGINFWTNTLALVFARQDVAKRAAVQALLLAGNLAAIVEDQNGEFHFMGADDACEPAAATANTGTASTDANNYTINIQDITSELPYFVTRENMQTIGLID